MSNITAGNFAHRPNMDGTFDSICRTCLRTVVRSEKEENLASCECAHDCITTAMRSTDSAIRLLEFRHVA